MAANGRKCNKKCSNVNWTRHLTTTLIELYEAHSNLWDVSSEHYKNRNLRKSSLDEISNTMGIPVNELNDKIHNLRCQFQTINRKRYKTKSGQAAGDNFVVRWEYYDALKFLNGPTGVNSETTVDSLANENQLSEKIYDTQGLTHVIGEETENDSQNNTDFEEDFLSSPLYNETASTSSCATTPLPSPTCSTTPHTSTSRVATLAPLIQQAASPLTIEKKGKNKRKMELEHQAVLNPCLGVMSAPADSFEIFGDYVADELRNMNSKAPGLQSRAKRNIQRIILEMNESYDARISVNSANYQPLKRQSVDQQAPQEGCGFTNIIVNTTEQTSVQQFYEDSQDFLQL